MTINFTQTTDYPMRAHLFDDSGDIVLTIEQIEAKDVDSAIDIVIEKIANSPILAPVKQHIEKIAIYCHRSHMQLSEKITLK